MVTSFDLVVEGFVEWCVCSWWPLELCDLGVTCTFFGGFHGLTYLLFSYCLVVTLYLNFGFITLLCRSFRCQEWCLWLQSCPS